MGASGPPSRRGAGRVGAAPGRCLDVGAPDRPRRRGVTAGRPGRIRSGPVQDRPIGRRPDREQRRHARPTRRIEHRDERVATAADGGTRREDEVEVRAAVAEDDEVDIEPSRRPRRPGRRPRSRARGRRPRRAHRSGSARSTGRTGTRQRLAGGRDLRPGPDQQRPSPGTDPEPLDQADDGPRRHDPRPVRTRHERHAVVRAGRRHDRAGPDLEMGIRRDRARPARRTSRSRRRRSGPRPRPPRPPRPAASSVPIASPEPAPRIPCQPAPIPGSASMTVDAGPGLGRTQRREEPGAPAADDEDVRVDAPRSAGRRGPRVRPATAQPTASAEPAQHIEIALAQPARSQESVVVEGRRDPARHEPDQRQQVALDRWPGVLAARDQALAHRHAARPDARHAVDLALAPAALAGRAHQPARSMEAEAARQRSAGRRPAGSTASGSPSTPS